MRDQLPRIEFDLDADDLTLIDHALAALSADDRPVANVTTAMAAERLRWRIERALVELARTS